MNVYMADENQPTATPDSTTESPDPPKQNTTPRRSTRNKTPKVQPPPAAPLQAPSTIPSASNAFTFQHDSPSGLTSKDLDSLLKPPARPKAFPSDLAGQKMFVAKSYNWLGTRPKAGMAEAAVREVEESEAAFGREVEMVMERDDVWDELWGVREWEE
ncbi:hypothetical protein BDW02DRAFT_593683 [Decorospora gaudefroyi]|uniref:Uncharacterized protein n=1 Tax=Decorospora gaudefroyi TaxID=184978 RepID=A0A6A5KSV4_9PLEO|nr:hypothetical protein BDW02DRAFT_593683 [Decorospora gaudefroyi]